MKRRDSPGQRCHIHSDLRCDAQIEVHETTSIQGFASYGYYDCAKKHRYLMHNKAGEFRRFCGTHRRMASEGKIDANGAVMPKGQRSDCYMYDIPYFHIGEWTDE